MKILFLSLSNPRDKKAFSGTFYSMYDSLLKRGHKIEWVGEYSMPFLLKVKLFFCWITAKAQKRKFPYLNSSDFSKSYAKQKAEQIREKEINADIVFAPMSSSLMANLDFSKPVIYYSDSTFDLLNNYYIKCTDSQLKESNLIDYLAMSKSYKCLFASNWARRSADEYYNIETSKLETVALAPNIELREQDFVTIQDNINKRQLDNSTIYITFIGVDWKRKGGDYLMKIVSNLTNAGVTIMLNVIGCTIPQNHLNNVQSKKNINLRNIAYLDKNKKADYDIFFKILSEETHFLIVPSVAECYGIVYREAAMFGIPSFGFNTGGVPEAIENEKTGFVYSFENFENEVTSKILYFTKNNSEYLKFCINCFRLSQSNTWNQWSLKVENIMLKILNENN